MPGRGKVAASGWTASPLITLLGDSRQSARLARRAELNGYGATLSTSDQPTNALRDYVFFDGDQGPSETSRNQGIF